MSLRIIYGKNTSWYHHASYFFSDY